MDNKRMLQHCIVACVVVLAGCVTPMGGGQLAPGTSQVCPAEANSCQIDVRIDCNALAACTGVVDPKVLLVNKGNGTFMQSRGSLKRSLKIDLNKNVKGQRLGGATTLNLHSAVRH